MEVYLERINQFEAIFNPQSIAVVGASRERKIGGLAVGYLLSASYKGESFR